MPKYKIGSETYEGMSGICNAHGELINIYSLVEKP
jgi:hypothetical protein